MANPYTTVSVTNYNATPPSDDGTQASQNEITWAKHKTKLGDPIKTAVESINTNVLAAFAKIAFNGISTHSGDYTVLAADQGKILSVTGTTTITLIAAATALTPFHVTILNSGTATVTVDGNGTETIDGSLTLSLLEDEYAILVCDGSNWVSLNNKFVAVDIDFLGSTLSNLVLSNVTITDYGETINDIGSIGGGTQDIDLELGNVVKATVDTGATTFTISNPQASGTETSFTLKLRNGGSQTLTWPASVDWGDDGEPSWSASGLDVVVFHTDDAGTTWLGHLAGTGFT